MDLSDPALRLALSKSFRQRVPASEVEDLVQATLTEALAANRRPQDAESARRWLWGIARHKVADFHRRGRREIADNDADAPVSEAPHDATDLMRWAEDQLPQGEDAPRTFEWLLREGDGDKLEHIADEESLPAPRVRQRVSRLRKHLRSRWALEVAAVAALVGVVVLAAWKLTKPRAIPPEERIVREVPSAPPREPSPVERAAELRREALPRCGAGDRLRCLEGLDEARRLDPAGDATPEVQDARQRIDQPRSPLPVPTMSSRVPPKKPTTTSLTPMPSDATLPSPRAPGSATPRPFDDRGGSETGGGKPQGAKPPPPASKAK